MRKNIYKYEERLKRNLDRIKNSPEFTNKNKSIIKRFYNYSLAHGLSIPRILKYLEIFYQINKILKKDFDKATKKDLIKLIGTIGQRDYSEWTKVTYRIIIKKFYKWLNGDKKCPKKAEWIKTTVNGNGNHKLPEELLTEEEIIKLIQNAGNSRDRAIISLLYESGCRIGEITSLKIKNIQFDDLGAQIIVNGKTGMRRMRVISCVPYLSEWLKDHPFKSNPEAYLCIGIGTKNKNKLINYSAIREMLIRAAKKAGITKRVNPHSFRHARATFLAKHLTEAQMKQYFGWVQASDMASVYVHLSGRDVDDALLKLHGIETPQNNGEETILKIQKCSRCEFKNPATIKFCGRCGLPLDTKTAMELEEKRGNADDIMSALLKDSEVQKILIKKLRELGLGDKMEGGKK